ncbi:PIN domain-containing protein [Pseudomonas gingeri]|uniref:PIN domain-containing protein n=1 Tax=Pseudomonas gingeri TaxID=117681 RepID=UPI0015A24ACC|nr:PIN domain-containing protein [Pseudomonas gingeri]NWD04115.1 PIN domain-containing protein [Pseudomonas gingeri]NWE33913.1 PIN domain-containing protein [Pseudomonas gingeri]NWE58001.1 PIN domain-containing protein [Pseudomonas gingeri]NWF04360.1 PIN domain-containing protein [Pseudomonas gingeri]
MSKIIFLDTSFLLELFRVPHDSLEGHHEVAKTLMSDAFENGYHLYCTIGVLYELANHIVDVKNYDSQRKLATQFQEMVALAWEKGSPFSIVPNSNSADILAEFSSLPELCEKYKSTLRQGLSLVDCTIVEAVTKAKINYTRRRRRWNAHIWTRHGELKALEPDNFEHSHF